MATACKLLAFPPEILLHILSYLDLPELAVLSQVYPELTGLTADPLLHRKRILVVAPSRIEHSLFGQSPQGCALRPTIGDLVHRGVMRGLNIERRWRNGMYMYSTHSVKQYETLIRLQRRHACDVVTVHLRRRNSAPKDVLLGYLRESRVLPDAESSSPSISRSLIPTMHQLKWSIQKDRLAKMVRDRSKDAQHGLGLGAWLEARGKNVLMDGERVRLAVCPSVRKIVRFYESLGR